MTADRLAEEAPDFKKLEAQSRAKIAQMESELKTLENEVAIINGKIKNRSVNRIAELEPENQKLQEEIQQIQRILLGTLIDNSRPGQSIDEKLQYENYKAATLEYMRKLEIEPETWKSIES